MRRSEEPGMDVWLALNAGMLLSALSWSSDKTTWYGRLAPLTVLLPILTACYVLGHTLVWLVRG